MYKYNPPDNTKPESQYTKPTVVSLPALIRPTPKTKSPSQQEEENENAFISYKAIKPIPIDKYKLKYCLEKYDKECQKTGFFWAVVGIFITLLLTKASATFHEAYGIPAATWEGFFLFLAAAAFLYIIWFVLKFFWFVVIRRKTNDIQAVVKCVNSENPDD